MVAEQQLAAMDARMKEMEAAMTQMRGENADLIRHLNEQKTELTDKLSLEFNGQKILMDEIIKSARTEFSDVKAGILHLCKATEEALKTVNEKIENIEADKGSGGADWKAKGYIPVKNLVPKTFSNKEEDWRRWQDDASDYFDNINPGMRELLKDIELEMEPIDDDWLTGAQNHSAKVRGDKVQIWRALKNLTDGEARKVVTSVKSENGFRAWQKLHMRFGPSLSSKQGLVLMELGGMVAKPAKSPAETRALLTEMEQKIKLVEEITGEDVSDNHAKSVLVGILDPTTRQHTAMHHGSKTTCDQLKRVVLEFVNNVSRKDDCAMQVGRISTEEEICQEAHHDEEEDYSDTFLGVVGAWTQCYKCQGYGHLAKDCASKGKGKGGDAKGSGGGGKAKGKGWYEPGAKGKGKDQPKGGSKGKGKRGPLYGGCWNCGGSHFAAECPVKGGGKGAKGLNAVEDWYSTEWSSAPSVRALSYFSEVNRSQEGRDASRDGWQLVDYTRRKIKQGQVKKERKERRHCAETPREHCATIKHQPGDMTNEDVKSLRIFQTIEPEGVNRVLDKEWEEIELAVDSGASETVIGEDMLTAVETKEGPASRRGVQYEVANGVRIPNLGEKQFKGFTAEGLPRNLKAQVCEVNKALLSVNRLVQTGNRVVFDDAGSYIQDKTTGEKMWLREQGGMYMLKMWVRGEGF